MAFTYRYYRSILSRFASNKYISSFFGEERHSKKNIYLRHDVDCDIDGIRLLAEQEEALGFRSTWFFLPDCPIYNLLSKEVLDVCGTLTKNKHRIGLHIDASKYDTYNKLYQYIQDSFNFYSKVIPLSKTISFHRPSPSLYGKALFDDFTGAYEKRYFEDIVYVSDSNRRKFWNGSKIDFTIRNGLDMQFLTHPLWWHEEDINPYQTAQNFIGRKSNDVVRYLVDTCKIYNSLCESRKI